MLIIISMLFCECFDPCAELVKYLGFTRATRGYTKISNDNFVYKLEQGMVKAD